MRIVNPVVVMTLIIVASLAVAFATLSRHPSNKLELEVFNTPQAMEIGLADRKEMPQDHAGLFVWKDEQQRCMWAKDMKFDLDLAFLNRDQAVVQVEIMRAGDTNPHCAKAQYVIEANRGVFVQ